MLLMLAEKLVPINLFLKFLQTGTLIYSSISAKLNCLLNCLAKTEEELQNHDSNETSKIFFKSVILVEIEFWMQWPWSNLRDCTLVNQSESPELVNKFLQTITYDFIADLIKEIDTALKDDRPMIHAFNIFLSSEVTSLIDRNKQLVMLNNHYWNDISDTYQSKSTFAGKLIDPIAQKIESKEFLSKFEDVNMYLLDRVKSDAKKTSVGST